MRNTTLVVVSVLALGLAGCDAERLKSFFNLPMGQGDKTSPSMALDPDAGTNAVPPGYLYLAWEFPRNGAERFEVPVGDAYPLWVNVSTYQDSIGTRQWTRRVAYQIDPRSSATGTVDADGRVVGTTPGGLTITASLGSGVARVLLAIKPKASVARRVSDSVMLGYLPESQQIIQSADDWTAYLDGLQASRSAWVVSDAGSDFASARERAIDFTTSSVVAVLVAPGFLTTQPTVTHLSDDGKTVHVVIPGSQGYQSDFTPGVVPHTQGYFFTLPKLPDDATVQVERLEAIYYP